MKISKLLIAIFTSLFVAFSGVSGVYAAEATPSTTSPKPYYLAAQCDGCPSDLFGDNGVFRQITNIIVYIVGVVAVIMLIYGGIRYMLSGGDSKKVTDAKNTILYAIIGLVICFLAFAIVNFVINSIPSDQKNETTGSETSLITSSSTDC